MMSFLQENLPFYFQDSRVFSDFLREIISAAGRDCDAYEARPAGDDSVVLRLKFVAIASILVSGAAGVSMPFIGRGCAFLRNESDLFSSVKAFAAGVILATGFVHMLPDGSKALKTPCLPEIPWSKFPFSEFFAMLAALATLLVDFLGLWYHARERRVDSSGLTERVSASNSASSPGEVDGIHLQDQTRHHIHGQGEEEDGTRQAVSSQILELGIVSHSIIIGLSLGVSHSSSTIQPLIIALSFHQFFEGFALGGCISEARFRTRSAIIMATFFALTTPIGIGAGIAIASSYNPNSVGALVGEGTLDSLSAGILIYLALVELIAAEFQSKKMISNLKLQLISYFFLFLGAASMSSLAIWA